MKILIKQAIIADPSSPFAGTTQDICIVDGYIVSIANTIEEEADQVIRGENLQVHPGWVDIFAHFHDPGAEHKETLWSGAQAAAVGGFTDVFVVPNTQPVIHSKGQVAYVVQRSAEMPAVVHPIGAITRNCEGKDLAEMYDMRSSGAVAFSDGWNPLQSGQVMLKALQYVKRFGGVIIQVPDERSLSKHGLINEGVVSTRAGLPGKPAIAERLMIARDIELLRYTQSKLHITGVSTAAGIDLIRKAKAEGLSVTCSVTPYHLYFTDADVAGYDTDLKVDPPLRTASDKDALIAAVLDGTVDIISSHHLPQDLDSKACEFEYAAYGMEGLETCVPAIMKAIPQLSADRLAALLSVNARQLFGLEPCHIQLDQHACITVYDHHGDHVVERSQLSSLSGNNAFIGRSVSGKVIGTIRGKRLFLNE